MRSLTKPAAPGLRIGALAARGPAAARLRAARVVEDFFVTGPLQEAALEIVTSPTWRRHLHSLTAELRQRRNALIASVQRHLPAAALPLIPRGGLHLWIGLPNGTDDEQLAQTALTAGVLINAGRHWYPTEPPGPFLRLTYAAAQPPELDAAIQKLADLPPPRPSVP